MGRWARLRRHCSHSALAALKRQGSSVLVVGNGRDCTELNACRRLLGDASAGPRYRILVSTDGDVDADRRIPADETRSGSVTVVDRTVKTRSAAAARPTSSIGNVSGATVDGEWTRVPRETIGEVIEGIEARGLLASDELRVCVDSLCPLLDAQDEQAVFRFVHALSGELRRVKAIGHFHLPVEYDAKPVETLAPAFDAVIELRLEGSVSEQRWHLQREDITTDWLAL